MNIGHVKNFDVSPYEMDVDVWTKEQENRRNTDEFKKAQKDNNIMMMIIII